MHQSQTLTAARLPVLAAALLLILTACTAAAPAANGADVESDAATDTNAEPTEAEAVTEPTDTEDVPTEAPETADADAVAENHNDCETPFPVDRLRNTWALTDFCSYEDGVIDEIISGGVPRDGIPPIDDPAFDTLTVADEWLEDRSPVIALEVDGEARAYPLAILTRHEIVNDVIAGRPVAVTFCPLCNSAIVFDRTVDGEVYRFGVSGLLRNSDLIMWDDVTESWWQQFTGTGIVGTHTGDQLDILPSLVVGYSEFKAQFPDGMVLSPGTRTYGDNPYTLYDSTDDPFLFLGEVDDRLFATERVLGAVLGGEPVAYPFETLYSTGVINDTVGGQDIVVFWQQGAASALDARSIDDSKDVGMAAMYSRVLNGETLEFELDADGNLRDVQTGSRWNVFGVAVEGELEGSQLAQELAFPHFWFAWAAFRPDTTIYGQS